VTDEGLRIRGYLQAQAAKLAPGDIIDKVRAAMADLRRAALAVPAERFDERPEPEEWSGNEVMAHVVDAGRHFGDQVVAILDGRPRDVASGARAAAERHTAAEWSTILQRDRDVLFERVLRADPQTALDAMIEHGMFGPLNWREILLFTRLHDLDHAGQLQKIVTAFAAPRPV
jgi:hypothetical protein